MAMSRVLVLAVLLSIAGVALGKITKKELEKQIKIDEKVIKALLQGVRPGAVPSLRVPCQRLIATRLPQEQVPCTLRMPHVFDIHGSAASIGPQTCRPVSELGLACRRDQGLGRRWRHRCCASLPITQADNAIILLCRLLMSGLLRQYGLSPTGVA
jgi:hypothetical protein